MFKDLNQLMKQAREMQAKMQSLQEELAKREVQGSSGGGMVVVTLNGRGEMLRIHIEPQVVSDVEMLEDLVTSAFRDAHRQVQELAQRELGGLGGLLGGLPGA
jgi:DNA-binding YbaB/EbfC family protein